MAFSSRFQPLRSLCTVRATFRPRRTYTSTSGLFQRDASSASTIPVFRDLSDLRPLRRKLYANNRQVGFVPTMGALHEGHISLVRRALSENTDVFVSIYVNPTQFGVNEDLDKYPKTWEADMARLKELDQEVRRGGDADSHGTIAGVFAPTTQIMYPTLPPSSEIDGDGSFVTITPMGKLLEGASRPVFFRGVATVCTKLFNAVQPDKVYFGQKDVQQSVLIRRMVKDFLIPTEVVVAPTERESDGLAMSSRNVYLGERRRKEVDVLSKALFAAKKAYEDGERSVGSIRRAAFDTFSRRFGGKGGEKVFSAAMKIEIDYIAMSDLSDMSILDDAVQVDPQVGAILSAAIKVWPVSEPQNEAERGQIAVRLIDNVILEPR